MLRKTLLSLFALLCVCSAYAQIRLSTVPPMNGGNGAQGITFEITANSAVILDQFEAAYQTSNTAAAQVWYRPGGILHAGASAPNVSTTNGWVLVGTSASTIAGLNAGTTANPILLSPIPVPLNLTIPAGQTFGFYIGNTTGSMIYSGTSATLPAGLPDTITDGTITIRMGTGKGFGGSLPTPVNTVRAFNGAVNYFPASGLDARMAALVRPSSLSVGVNPVEVRITNSAADSIVSAVFGYQLGANPPVIEGPITFPTQLNASQSFNYTFTTPINIPAAGTYTFKTWVSSPNGQSPDNNPANDTITRQICTGITGTFTVGGVGADFADLDAAVAALNCGLVGPITFLINPGVYVGSYNLQNILGASATNTISFVGAQPGVMIYHPTATGQPRTAFDINGIRSIKFENIHFVRTADATTAFAMLRFTNAPQAEVINCQFSDSTANTSLNNRAIEIATSDSITIQGNNFNGFGYVVYLRGLIGVYNQANRIVNNVINNYKIRGIDVQYEDRLLVSGNTINQCLSVSGSGLFLSGCSNMLVERNRVTGAIGNYGIYGTNLNGTVNNPNRFINNEINGITAATAPSGFYFVGTFSATATPVNPRDYVALTFNTVNLVCSNASTTSTLAGAIYVSGGSVATPAWSGINLLNNNFTIFNQASTPLPVVVRALNFANLAVSDSTTSNYNNFFSQGNTEPFRVSGGPGATTYDFTTWQTTFTRDANSYYVDPLYALPGIGVPTNLVLNNAGLSIASITEDITGAARGATPDIGAYEFSQRNFDIALLNLVSPVSGSGLTAAELVTVRMTNAGLNPLSNIPMFYSLNSGAVQTGLFAGPINPGDTVNFTFPTPANLLNQGNYNFLVYAGPAADDFRFNDTLRTSILSLNCVSSYPYLETFDAGNGGWTTGGTNNSWAHGTPTGSVINRAASGAGAWVTNLTGTYNGSEESYIESPCFTITGLTAPRVRFSIWWLTETAWDGVNLQYSTDGGTSWQVLGSVGSGIQNWYTRASVNSSNNLPVWAGDVGATPPTSGGWVTAEHDASVILGASSVIFRFVFTSDPSLNREGIGIDDFFFGDPPAFDAALQQIISPTSSCGNTANTAVHIVIKNDGAQPISNFPVGYQINANPVVIETFTRTIAPNDTAHYIFATTANLVGPATYAFRAFVSVPNDAIISNDTLTSTIQSTVPISNFPYLENFDSGNGGWTTGGANSSWAHGTPTGSVINSAASGTSAWVTNLSGDYNNNENSFLQSPCFATAGLTAPRVRFSIWWLTETAWDGVNLQYSTNGGASWQVLGSFGSGFQNWYNRANVNSSNSLPVWTGDVGATPPTSGGWVTAEHDASVLLGASSVLFRFVFTSDGSGVRQGIGIDNFFFGDPAPIDGAVTAILNPTSRCGLSATESITITIRNDGSQPLSNFPVFYQINNLTPVQETFTASIAPAASANYTFTTTANMAATGAYTVRGYVRITGDPVSSNDTNVVTVNNIAPINTFPFLQNFETWTNNTNANFFNGWSGNPQGVSSRLAWHTNSGTTSSLNTGPDVDKTTGTAVGKYVFLETSFGSTGDTAFLLTPCLDISSLPVANLSYWYHMFGASTGSLVVQALVSGVWQQIDLIVGEQQTSGSAPWLERVVVLPAGTSQIRWGGVRGSSFTGDIAIDDVEIRTAPAIDAQVVRVVSPTGGGCGLSATTPVSMVIRNGGLNPISNFPVQYDVNGGAPIIQTITQTLNPGDTLLVNFTTTINLSVPNNYTIRYRVSVTGDANPRNDTLSRFLVSKPAVTAFPYFQNFESGNGGWTAGGANSSWALGTPSGTVINAAASGQNAWVTNLSGNYNGSEQSFVESSCFQLAGSGLLAPRVRFKIWWLTETTFDGANLQYSTDGGNTWLVLGSLNSGIQNWYTRANVSSSNGQPVWTGDATTTSNPASSGGWVTAEHDIMALMSFNSVIFRVHFSSDPSVHREGIAFDDFFIGDPLAFDVAVNAMSSPTSGCSLGNHTVTMSIKNEGAQTLTNIPVSYQHNNGTIHTETFAGPLGPNQIGTHTFATSVNLSAVTTHNIKIFTGLTGDLNRMNDTINFQVINIRSISTFPYFEDFEGGPGDWTVGGQSPSWRLGVPSGTIIDSSFSGINAWVTNLNGNYNTNELSWIESPCFNFSSLVAPELELRIWWLTATNAGAYIQYSTDLVNWLPLGDIGTGLNWYNRASITNYNAGVWSGNATSTPGTSGGYVLARHELISQQLAGQSQVKFRIVFRSGATLGEGVAIDDFRIIETASNGIDGSVSSIVTPNTLISILNPTQVSINIRNVGQVPISNFDVAFAINNVPISAQTYVGLIQPGANDTFTFSGNWIPPQSGTFRLCAYMIGIDNDVNRRNDTACANVNVTSLAVNERNPILLYPNPANDFVTFYYDNQMLGDDLVIFDGAGRMIKQIAITGETDRLTVRLDDVSGGFYFYRYRSRNGNFIGKFVVTK